MNRTLASRVQRFNWPAGRTVDALVRARTLLGFTEFLEVLGGDSNRVLSQCGLSKRDLTDPDQWLSFRSVTEVYDLAASELNDRTFGLRLASRNDLSYLGPIAALARHSKTAGAALEGVSRFFSVQNTALSIELERGRSQSILRFELPDHLREGANLWMEDSLARACQFWGEITGANLQPLRVLIRHAREHPLRVYRKTFGAPVEFGQEQDALILETRALDTPTRASDSQTHQVITRYLEERTAEGDGELVAIVTTLLQSLIPMQRGHLESVAEQLHVHPRTLQRYLRRTGVSFANLLETQKRQMAERLLSGSALPLVDIAHYIGYADQSAFNHAFDRWHQCTPGSWRAQVNVSHTTRQRRASGAGAGSAGTN